MEGGRGSGYSISTSAFHMPLKPVQYFTQYCLGTLEAMGDRLLWLSSEVRATKCYYQRHLPVQCSMWVN